MPEIVTSFLVGATVVIDITSSCSIGAAELAAEYPDAKRPYVASCCARMSLRGRIVTVMATRDDMARSFGAAAEAYDTGRPDYPEDAVAWLRQFIPEAVEGDLQYRFVLDFSWEAN